MRREEQVRKKKKDGGSGRERTEKDRKGYQMKKAIGPMSWTTGSGTIEMDRADGIRTDRKTGIGTEIV